MSNTVEHNDIIKLQQYHLSLHHELRQFEEENPQFRNGSKIVKLSRKMVEVSAKIADDRIIGGAKVSEPKTQTIVLLYINGLLLVLITAFLVMLFNSVQVLESKVFPTGQLFTEEVVNAKR